MDTDGGGWTVFQRREDGSTNFFRTWIEYHYGFGQLSGEHWLGNSKLHRLTSQRSYELRVDLEDFEGEKSYASYDHFAVEDERDGYRLSLRGFNGTAGDSLLYHHGQPFSTRDRDDDASKGNCAKLYSGAWWFQRCHFSNLNGKYYEGGKLSSKGTAWYHWKNTYYSVKRSEMKIRPTADN
ncbi:fibrinogen C domain-containing protein 1-like [Lytechinus pictus]|uniref:fibrinogen C domain-containing protein 1-like n=1 Tax=Lytechinus pictus TaxID=7653 RepID=UPI0030B9BA3A